MMLRAGAATRDISPTLGVQLCGYPHVARLATGIHDPLLASVLYLENGTGGVVLAVLDLLMLNANVARDLRRSVAEALQLPEACVLISCTHTHSGPVSLHYLPWKGDPAMPPPDPAYLASVAHAVVEAALEAKSTAEPARIAWTTANARGVGGNRHAPDGVTDPEAGVLAVSTKQRWLSLAVTYGMHPTVLHEDSTFVSADFPFYTKAYLRDALGPELTVLYHTGPAGDQSPRHFVSGQSFAEAERLGKQLGAAVVTSLDGLKFQDTADLGGVLVPVDLPRREFPGVEQAELQLAAQLDKYERLRASSAGKADLRTAEVAIFGAEGALRLAKAQRDGEIDNFLHAVQPFEVQALRIGEACAVGFPGELFAHYGLDLKRRAGERVVPIAYANGELQGYIVTAEAATAGGYEAAGSLFTPNAGTVLVDAALAAIRALPAPTASPSR